MSPRIPLCAHCGAEREIYIRTGETHVLPAHLADSGEEVTRYVSSREQWVPIKCPGCGHIDMPTKVRIIQSITVTFQPMEA